ncbi:hypothetical protein EV175_005843, partial [Coemansia sp. RSA 1933]
MHDYNITTFGSPTYCEYCGGFLWGLTRQGVRCSKCKTTAHKRCAVVAETQCSGDRGLATLVLASPLFPVTSPGSSSTTISSSTTDSAYVAQLDGMFWRQLDEEVKLNDLVSAQAEQPLSLFQTLPTNFMQFTAKIAPLTMANRAAIDIVMWRRPRHSLAAMAVYTTYCLRPNLLLATPLLLLIAYIVFSFFNSELCPGDIPPDSTDNLSATASPVSDSPRASPQPTATSTSAAVSSSMRGRSSTGNSIIRMRRRNSQPPAATTSPPTRQQRLSQTPPASPDTASDSHATASASSAAKDAATAEAYERASAPPTSPKGRVLVRTPRSSSETPTSARTRQRVDLEAVFGVASFGSARYTENVHTTQIMTGTYVHAYDWVAAHAYLVDWSQPEVTWRILAACVCAQLVLLVVVYWVPWYMLFLVGGNGALLSMSPHMRAFAKVYGFECALFVHEWVVLKWLRLRFDVLRMPVVRWILRRRRRQRSRAARQRTFASAPQSTSTDTIDTYTSDSDGDGGGYALHSGYLTPPPLLSLASSTAASSTATLVRRPHMVNVFENQRWWLGFGWIPRLGTNERAKWSDENGRKRYASLNDFMPADGYEWADDGSAGWEIDRYWALPLRTDEDGW